MHDVARLKRKRFEQCARDLGLTRSQYQALAVLSRNEGIHQGGLAELLEIEPITLVRILDKLEARGLVERRQHGADRRVWLLFLTPAAHPILSQVYALSEFTTAEALQGIPEEDRTKLIDILTQMKANLLEACRQPVDDKEAGHG
ncbi:MarR family winged helix-turn-helix transcriptional regulator [Labrys neptuniae]